MRTTKPISTISFNTVPYLKQMLDELVNNKIVSFYAFIQHKPEDDEGLNKFHCHVYIEPSKMVQTDDIREKLREIDPSNVLAKPLGCLPFNHSKFDDWYMYCLHDKAYLSSKNQSRKYHYEDSNFVSYDYDAFLSKTKLVDMTILGPYKMIQEAIEKGLSWLDFLSQGRIPIFQVNSYKAVWDAFMYRDETNRNGREGHPNDMPGEMPGVDLNDEYQDDFIINEFGEVVDDD